MSDTELLDLLESGRVDGESDILWKLPKSTLLWRWWDYSKGRWNDAANLRECIRKLAEQHKK